MDVQHSSAALTIQVSYNDAIFALRTTPDLPIYPAGWLFKRFFHLLWNTLRAPFYGYHAEGTMVKPLSPDEVIAYEILQYVDFWNIEWASSHPMNPPMGASACDPNGLLSAWAHWKNHIFYKLYQGYDWIYAHCLCGFFSLTATYNIIFWILGGLSVLAMNTLPPVGITLIIAVALVMVFSNVSWYEKKRALGKAQQATLLPQLLILKNAQNSTTEQATPEPGSQNHLQLHSLAKQRQDLVEALADSESEQQHPILLSSVSQTLPTPV